MLIQQLNLYTAKLKEQFEFYSKILDIPVIWQAETYIEFRAGNSRLKFTYKDSANPAHFAFNIPSNKAAEALNWLRQRVRILGFDGHDIIDFPNWNAESIYFYDADKNIVEFIARKNLHNHTDELFNPNQLLNISEIGVATDNIQKTYRQLNGINPLPVYSGDFDRFCAAGDEHGLFILADLAKKQWFPTGDIIHQADFELHGDYNMAFRNGEALGL